MQHSGPWMGTCATRAGALLSLFAFLGIAPIGASATSHDTPTLDELIAESDLIVHATVVTTSVHSQGPNGQPGIHTRVDLEVHETLKGTPRSTLEVWVQGGRMGGRMRVVVGQARFEPLEEAVLFLFRDPNGAYWPAGMGAGKWSVSHEAGVTTARSGTEALAIDALRGRIRGAG